MSKNGIVKTKPPLPEYDPKTQYVRKRGDRYAVFDKQILRWRQKMDNLAAAGLRPPRRKKVTDKSKKDRITPKIRNLFT